jgi:hypothetical protein
LPIFAFFRFLQMFQNTQCNPVSHCPFWYENESGGRYGNLFEREGSRNGIEAVGADHQAVCAEKKIPFHKINRSVRFKPSEIERWVENRKGSKDAEQGENTDGGLFGEMPPETVGAKK